MVEHRRELQVGWTYGGNFQPIKVVAVIDYIDGTLFDWAAYIGTGSVDGPELVQFVADRGDKLYSKIAFVYFPNLPKARYRE